jgi:hypothetical protein|tara:strand:- start:187 stop:432 length:246 start_codon:yes stop_codon:yes gene_type:complete
MIMSDNKVKPVVKKRFIIKKKKDKDNFINEPIQQPLCMKEKYLLTFTDEENETYKIAKEHLQSSFNLEKSVGFCKYDVKTT